MAVISKDKLWPGPVPYVVDQGAEKLGVDDWIDKEINKRVGSYVLIKHEEKPTVHHISISTGYGKSESIGYDPSKAVTKVSASSKGGMIHEILHALGFHHEQFHRGYAWDYAAIPVSAKFAPELVDLQDKVKDSPWNRSLFAKVNERLGSEGEEQTARLEKAGGRAGGLNLGDRELWKKKPVKWKNPELRAKYRPKKIGASSPAAQQLVSYIKRVKDKQTFFSPECDYDSSMMYDELAAAAADTYKTFLSRPKEKESIPKGMGEPSRRKIAKAQRGLSEEDVLALQTVIVPAMKKKGLKSYGT